MFEQLFEESPMIRKMREQHIMRGKVIELQELLVKFIRTQYPDIAEFASMRRCRAHVAPSLFSNPSPKTLASSRNAEWPFVNEEALVTRTSLK